MDEKHQKRGITPGMSYMYNTVWCHYNVVKFLQIPHNSHPIACPWGRDMGCLLWIQIAIYVLPQQLEYCMQNHVVVDRITTALHCTGCIYWWLRAGLLSISVTNTEDTTVLLLASDIHCSAVKTQSIFSQNIHKTPHSSPVRARYGVPYVDPASDWYSVTVPVIIYEISYNIGPRYNGTWLY